MQTDAERTLNNLHVLAALNHNDKLLTNDECFDIYSPTAMRGLYRMWLGERRHHNLQRVRGTIRSAIDFATKTLQDANTLSGDERDNVRLNVETIVLQHLRMCDALLAAKEGLTNLKLTYRDDAALVSQIVLMSQEIDDFQSIIRVHGASLRERFGRSADAPSCRPSPLAPPATPCLLPPPATPCLLPPPATPCLLPPPATPSLLPPPAEPPPPEQNPAELP